MRRFTGYQKIMRAAARGTGVSLSWEDVREMSGDDAIRQLAYNDDNPKETAEFEAYEDEKNRRLLGIGEEEHQQNLARARKAAKKQ